MSQISAAGKLFEELPGRLAEEDFRILLDEPGFRLERIVSTVQPQAVSCSQMKARTADSSPVTDGMAIKRSASVNASSASGDKQHRCLCFFED